MSQTNSGGLSCGTKWSLMLPRNREDLGPQCLICLELLRPSRNEMLRICGQSLVERPKERERHALRLEGKKVIYLRTD